MVVGKSTDISEESKEDTVWKVDKEKHEVGKSKVKDDPNVALEAPSLAIGGKGKISRSLSDIPKEDVPLSTKNDVYR